MLCSLHQKANTNLQWSIQIAKEPAVMTLEGVLRLQENLFPIRIS